MNPEPTETTARPNRSPLERLRAEIRGPLGDMLDRLAWEDEA